MNSKKILFIASYSGIMGANLSMLQLMIELKKRGHHPVLLIPDEGLIVSDLNKNGIEYVVSPYHLALCETESYIKRIRGFIKSLINPIFCLVAFFKVLLKYGNFDLIHSNSTAIHVGEFFKLLLQIPHIKHLREFGSLDYNLYYAWGNGMHALINRIAVDANIAISSSIMSFYEKKGFKNIFLVHNGVSFDRVYKECIRNQNGDINIICLGAISEKKNQGQVVDAVINLTRGNVDKIFLYLVGDDNNQYAQSLKCKVRENNCDDNIIFCGMQKDISPYMQKADIAIVPSLNEAFGRVTIEYMCNHIPIIVSNRGANIEIIEDNVDGLVYDVNSSFELEEKMLSLIRNFELRKILTENAFVKYRDTYTSAINAEKVLSVYNNVLGEV